MSLANEIILYDAAQVLEAVDFFPIRGKKILVTGATGLIGTHLLATLALLKQNDPMMEVYGSCHSKPEQHTVDIAEFGGIHLRWDGSTVDRYDVIIHAAGYAQPALFTKSPAKTLFVNTAMTYDLLCNDLRPGGRFLFISSSEVYSGLGGLVTETSIGTTTPSHSRSCYIEGKRSGEAVVNAYRWDGVNAKSARLSLAYGPGTRKFDKRAMSVFIEQALMKREVRLQYSGREPRTFCYVSDAIEMLWNVLLHGQHNVYNVGGESVTNMAGVAAHIANITGSDLIIPAEDTELPGAPQVVSMDLTRYKNEFGKKKFVDLETGLRRTVAWQKELYNV